MKLLLVTLFALAATVYASPKKYHYVSTKQFEDPESDHDMHPDPSDDEPKFANLRNGKSREEERTTDYWLNKAKDFVEQQVRKTANTNKAKNIILFLGDGMSHPSIAAARVAMGDESEKLSFENFPYTASSKTYCIDLQVSESACTATAYLSGVKTNDGVIGLSGNALWGNCAHQNDPVNRATSIGGWALTAGKDVGVVTTTRVTHASPAGVYAAVSNRDWEDDWSVNRGNCDTEIVDDIAEQLVHGSIGSQLKVVLGGGSRHFIDEMYQSHGGAGYRSDGKHLINEWLEINPERTYVNNTVDLLNIDPEGVTQLLGLFDWSHNTYNLDVQRDNRQDEIPSITQMTLKAIDILSQSEEGYFLFVEGGRIDHGHHGTQARYAIDETVEFSKAIEAALEKVDLEDTLVVVTADHGHVMTLSGYAARGNDIFGFGGNGQDGFPYMTLSYANGPGYSTHTTNTATRVDPRTLNRETNNFMFPATVPLGSETHGGEDVGIWAVGPWAHLFQGTVEQNVIPHVMSYASCIGNGLTMCDE